ncbi:type II toxin-antitoxin system HicA family toxin [bacterium]|nr:type II toxin-antitoxin system HicA family toxin [bacterium]
MASKLPAITGPELIKILIKIDGWTEKRRARHGVVLNKTFPDGRTRVTIIPTKKESLPKGTLYDILSDDQTGIGKDGLMKLL